MLVPSQQWVTGNIELVAPIAEGAMGSVWVAYHHRLHTRVAVKFVSEKLGDDTAEAMARFAREASTASQIKSPHVVQVMDSGVAMNGAPYIVMELLDGESLGQRLRTRGPLTLQEASEVIGQVAAALTKAHELGIVHRDIKPDNIFLCRADDRAFHCKVLDFGIAKQTRLPAMGGLTTEGKLVGTPEYMSPEQVLEDLPVSYRADLWALAVVMYASLTGELPFKGKTLGQLCINLVSRKPAPPSTLRPDLGAEQGAAIDAWFARALSRDAQNRYGSAREMADSFAALLRGVTPEALPAVNEDTERGFGSASDKPLEIERRRVPVLWAALALAGGGGVWAASGWDGGEPAERVSAALAPAAAAVVIEVQANTKQIVPSTTIDLDAIAVDAEPRPAKTAATPRPARPSPKPAAAPSPAPAADTSQRRGKSELGF